MVCFSAYFLIKANRCWAIFVVAITILVVTVMVSDRFLTFPYDIIDVFCQNRSGHTV